MAPPRASAVQQQQAPQLQPLVAPVGALDGGSSPRPNGGAKAARRRKGKQPPTAANGRPAAEKQQVQQEPLMAAQARLQGAQVVSSSPVGPVEPKRAAALAAAAKVPVAPIKQVSTDDADELDAGIELDGSSNSGSSVKDIADDQHQLKSSSASPVMQAAQQQQQQQVVVASTCTSLSGFSLATGGQVEEAPREPLQCIELAAKKQASLATKQQLAATQEAREADEQLLQAKLESSRHRKGSVPAEEQAEVDKQKATPEETPVPLNRTAGSSTKAPPLKRRLSSQTSQEGAAQQQEPGRQVASAASQLCKICSQHVYQMERMLAERFVYHKRCFRCHQCNQQLLISSYSSHAGHLYCKLHHRQLFQPQVKLDSEDDVDIVAKSRTRKRQMIICENEPAELPKDVVRSDTKLDDGLDQLNLNLNNILEKFEAAGGQPAPSSAPVLIEKPAFNIRKTLMAFERQSSTESASGAAAAAERPAPRKLASLGNLFNRQQSDEQQRAQVPEQQRPLPVRRSESLMMRLKKYESRIAGEQVEEDEDSDRDSEKLAEQVETADENNNNTTGVIKGAAERLPSVDLSSLKSQWESGKLSNGDSSGRTCATSGGGGASEPRRSVGKLRLLVATGGQEQAAAATVGSSSSSSSQVDEELVRVRQELAQRKSANSCGVRNIYENAIREAEQQSRQQQQQPAAKRNLSDLVGAHVVQKQFLQAQVSLNREDEDQESANQENQSQSNTAAAAAGRLPLLNLSNRANRLKERFELGLVGNSSSGSRDDCLNDDYENGAGSGEQPEVSRMEQLKRDKLEDLSVFTEGEIKAREARSLFQQIDRRISSGRAAAAETLPAPPSGGRRLASIGASMQAKLAAAAAIGDQPTDARLAQQQQQEKQPIRLTNNVRT